MGGPRNTGTQHRPLRAALQRKPQHHAEQDYRAFALFGGEEGRPKEDMLPHHTDKISSLPRKGPGNEIE